MSSRIAVVVYPGNPRNPRVWSGTPAGVVAGLEQAGVDVQALSADLPGIVDTLATDAVAALRLPRVLGRDLRRSARLSRQAATLGPELAALRTAVLRRRLRRVGRLDGFVQIRIGYDLPAGSRFVALGDMTIPQALELPYPEWHALSPKMLAGRIARQRETFQQAVACCLLTHWAADSVMRDYGLPPDRVHVVGVGRNHDPRPVPRDWTNPRFLFVGNDWKRKNGEAVVRAFSDVRRSIPAATLDVVGGHPRLDHDGVTTHGPLRADVASERDRLRALFERATCFVMPSWSEPAGIVYVEAAAAGIPSIGTTAGGCRDLIGDGGTIVDPADGQALLETMRELSNPATAARVGSIAAARAPLFTWPLVGQRILRALRLPGVDPSSLADFL